jgi:hypothetical protein
MKKKKSGKKRIVTSLDTSSKRAKMNYFDIKDTVNEQETGATSDSSVEMETNYSCCQLTEDKVPNTEALTDIIVERSCLPMIDTSFETAKILEGRSNGVPRKVSDADVDVSLTLHNDDAIKSLDKTYGSKDISRFYDVRKRTMVAKETPAFFEVSIASEFILRDLAHEMARNLTESFDDRSLRMFLGYKASTLKRERLLVVLAEYFFDVSHAMFAWKQTESEMQSEASGDALEKRILQTLFDTRALQKIGGFDKSSLLPHALSIYHLNKEGVSWEDSAKTEKGKALLKHHHDGKAVLAGQKRRGQRVRTRHVVSSSESSESGPRTRSSSITSYDGTESKRDGSGARGIVDPAQVEIWSEERQASLQMPDVLRVTLRKGATSSWGVLLSKEGDMCVVVRAPEAAVEDGSGQRRNAGLKIGDVILSVANERQDSADAATRDWFRLVVNMFKSSDELDLVVRRVGSSQSVLSDNSSRGDVATDN